MGNRLSKIVTRTGDDGTTGLADGTRRLKSDIRLEVIGDVDELNSFLGLLDVHHGLLEVQNRLFDLGAELALPDQCILEEDDVEALETHVSWLTERLPPLKEFILPGGGQFAGMLHVARAVCRRAERHLVRLAETEHVNRVSCQYLNRLSDFLFQLARIHSTQQVHLWQPKSKPSAT